MISLIDNQPVIFDQQLDCQLCRSAITWKQLVDKNDDITEFQFNSGVCNDTLTPEQVTCSDFTCSTDWSLGGGWAISSNTLNITNSVGNQDAEQSNVFSINNRYRLVIDIESISGSIIVSTEGISNQTISTAGTHTFYFERLVPGTDLQIRALNGTSTVINSVSVREIITENWVSIWRRTATGSTFVKLLTPSSHSAAFDFQYNFTTVYIDWETLGITNDGCYYLCLHDRCLNTGGQFGLYNGEFDLGTGSEGFTFVNNGPVTSNINQTQAGRWFYSTGGIADSTLTSTETNVKAGTLYTVKVHIVAIQGDTCLDIIFGNNSIQLTTSGFFAFTLTPDIDAPVVLKASTTTSDPDGVLITEYVRISVEGEDLICDHQSIDLKLGDYSTECTHVLKVLSNNENDLNFNWFDEVNLSTRVFEPQIRLKSTLWQKTVDPFREGKRSSQGLRKNIYGRLDKRWDFSTMDIEIYAHNFIALGAVADRVLIDDTEYYYIEDTYDNEQPAETEQLLSRVTIELVDNPSLIENKNC